MGCSWPVSNVFRLKVHGADVQLCSVHVSWDYFLFSFIELELRRNITSGLLQSEHKTNGKQWKVTDAATEMFLTGYIYIYIYMFSRQGLPRDRKPYARCQGQSYVDQSRTLFQTWRQSFFFGSFHTVVLLSLISIMTVKHNNAFH